MNKNTTVLILSLPFPPSQLIAEAGSKVLTTPTLDALQKHLQTYLESYVRSLLLRPEKSGELSPDDYIKQPTINYRLLGEVIERKQKTL
jgi:hypothetical protein